MSNNVTLPGTGSVIESVDIGAGVERQSVTISDRAGGAVDSIGGLTESAPASDTASSGLNGRLQRIAQRLTTALTGIVLAAGTNIIGQVYGAAATVSNSVVRPNDTTAYAANDAWSSSTSAPAALTFSSCVRSSGGTALLTDMVVTSSNGPGTLLQGELWLFDTAPTVINDNAAFTITDGEIKTLVAKIPFTIDSLGGANSMCHVAGLNLMVTGVASANLTGLIKIINAYTPAANEELQFRMKFVQVN